jgi:hypothetical protein
MYKMQVDHNVKRGAGVVCTETRGEVDVRGTRKEILCSVGSVE